MDDRNKSLLNLIFIGEVAAVQNYGAFISIPSSSSQGLVHRTQISKSNVPDATEVLAKGDKVWCKVISIAEDGKIGLSMKMVDQGSGKDLDPNGVQLKLDEQKRKEWTPNTQRKTITLDAVFNTTCSKCGTRGHLGKDCFQVAGGKTYELLPDVDNVDLVSQSGVSPQSLTSEIQMKLRKEKKKAKKKEKKEKKRKKKQKKEVKKAAKKRRRSSSTSSSSSEDSSRSHSPPQKERHGTVNSPPKSLPRHNEESRTHEERSSYLKDQTSSRYKSHSFDDSVSITSQSLSLSEGHGSRSVTSFQRSFKSRSRSPNISSKTDSKNSRSPSRRRDHNSRIGPSHSKKSERKSRSRSRSPFTSFRRK